MNELHLDNSNRYMRILFRTTHLIMLRLGDEYMLQENMPLLVWQ